MIKIKNHDNFVIQNFTMADSDSDNDNYSGISLSLEGKYISRLFV